MKTRKLVVSSILLLIISLPVWAQTSWKEIGNKENAPDVATEANYTLTAKGEFVVIYDDRSSYGEQRAKVKKYNGTKWTDLGAEAISEGRAIDFAIVEFNGKIYASYKDWPGGKTHIVSYDGNAWKSAGEPIEDATDSRLIAGSNKLYRAYYSGNKTRIVIFALEGNAWKEVGAAAPLEKDSRAPFDLAFNGNNELYIAYTNPLDIKQAKLKKLVGDSWADAGPQATNYTVKHIRLAFDGNIPHLAVYSDKDYNIYVMKLMKDKNITKDVFVWHPVGAQNGLAVTDFDDQLNFAISGGKPYIAYEQSRSDKMKSVLFTDNSWKDAGYLAEDTDAGAATRFVSSPGKLFVLFKDPNNNGVAIKQN